MNFLKIFEDIFRWILWVLLKFLLFICDQLFMAVKSIAYFNILSESKVWAYFTGFMGAFLTLFIVFRVAKRYLRSIVDEEEAEHFKPDNLVLKLAAIGFLIAVMPFLLKTFGNLLSDLINKIETIFLVNSDNFSSILIGSSDIGAANYKDIDLWDINEKTNGGDYLHIPSLNTFLCMFIATVFSFYLMLLIGIQIGGRMLSMVMKLIIAPYSFSSIIDEKNDSFATWWKLFIADFMATYVQMILLLVGTTLILGLNFNAGSAFASGLAKDIALIGALFGVLNAPNGISQIIGSDIGVSSALQSMQTTMMAAGISSSAGRLIGNAATFAGAGATYGVGRMFGGASMKSIAENTLPGMKTISGSIQGTAGGFSDGSGGVGTGGTSDLNLTMSESPGQQASFVSDRSGMSGWSSIPKGNGLGDTLSNIKHSGAPNVAAAVSNFDKSNGTVRQMLNSGNIGGVALRGATWGANKMYSASMNRLQKGFNKQNGNGRQFSSMQRNAMMYNNYSQANPMNSSSNISGGNN
jgi:hypothetical protein